MDTQRTIIEVNGVKLDVDMRTAVRIDELRIGARVKCLVKKYDGSKVCPGVVVGFEPFPTKPSIVVAYLDSDWLSAGLTFQTFNADTKDFEIVADIDNNAIEIDKSSVLEKFDRELAKKELEVLELRDKRSFFLAKFGRYFVDPVPV